MIDLMLGLVLVLVLGAMGWIERERLSGLRAVLMPDRRIRASHDAAVSSQTGGQSYYWRLTRQAGLQPARVWPVYLASKGLLAIGLGVLAARLAGTSAWLLIGGAALAGFVLPDAVLAWRRRTRRRAIRRHLSFFLDLLLSLVQAGLGLDEAFATAAREGLSPTQPLQREALLVVEELHLGRDRATAFHALADRTGLEELRAFAHALALAFSLGGSLETTLRAQAEMSRTKRRDDGLARVQVASAEILMPLLLCSFPMFAVLVLVPMSLEVWNGIQAVQALLRR